MHLPRIKSLRNPLILTATSLAYSSALLAGSTAMEILSSVCFVLILSAVLFRSAHQAYKNQLAPVPKFEVVITVVGIALGLLLPAIIGNKAADFFWAVDSLSTHIPRATAIADWLTGNGTFPFESAINAQGGLTQLWIGFTFWIFGEAPAASVLGLASFRILTCVVLIKICRELFGSKKFDIVFLFYALYPNALFHTTVYFKEALIHLLIATALLLLIRIYKNLRSPESNSLEIQNIVFLSAIFSMLYVERFYLVLLFLPLIGLMIAFGLKRRHLPVAIGTALVGVGIVYFHPYFQSSFSELAGKIREMREAHKSFPGINIQVNYEIPLWLAFLKSLFTPIWSPSKIEVFRGFSALITWGSFLGHVIILGYIAGAYRAVKKHGWFHLWIQIPFIVFLLAIAYVSPWAGRIRDSFAPLFVVYSTYYFAEYFWKDLEKIRGAIRGRTN